MADELDKAEESEQPVVDDGLAQGAPMDRGFMVGAFVGILALFAIPLLIQRDDTSEEMGPAGDKEVLMAEPAATSGSASDREPGVRVETGALSLPEPSSDGGVESEFQGSWSLEALLTHDGKAWQDTPVGSGMSASSRERWRFIDGERFHHRLSDGFSLSGRARTTAAEGLGPELGLQPTQWWLLETHEITSNAPGVEHDRDYHLIALDGESLLVLYIGDSLQGRGRPLEGGRFSRVDDPAH